ncbi:helix-turn-helix transcriptional regulator [Actinomadura fulvescens]|uniref:helix-turn-helix domain-containing protein n=1 Tax=Actinomadura fulvescens TaxID=46160 RepID=UPI0031E41D65
MSTSPQQPREALGVRLRGLRKDSRLPQRRLAELAGWHESRVSKLELGKQTPSKDDLRTWSTRRRSCSPTPRTRTRPPICARG